MSEHVSQALDGFMQKYLLAAKSHTQMLLTEFDESWPSECLSSNNEEQGVVAWQPMKRQATVGFDDLSAALDMIIHPDLVSYYTSYWSNNLNAKTDQGNLQLLQAWNQDDFERLQQNLVGHVLMKRRLKQPETLFFALTDEDDFIITLGNDSGEVLLEQVGLLPREVLAPNLTTFIQSLQPAP
jgi:SecY interacting protein Syd